MAYKQERNRLSYMSKQSKIDYLSYQVAEIGLDSKRLYGLVKKLTNRVKENTMPPGKTKEEYAEYFVEKTEKITKDLEQYTGFEPLVEGFYGLIILGSYRLMTEKIIMELNTTCYEMEEIEATINHRAHY